MGVDRTCFVYDNLSNNKKLKNSFSNSVLPTPTLASNASTVDKHTHSANADTGTTGHYIALADISTLLDVTVNPNGIIVMMPNGTSIKSTHTAKLNMPRLPEQARHVHLFPDLTGSLLSIGLLCDNGLTAEYTADVVIIRDGADVVLTGTRSPRTRLWMIEMPTATPLDDSNCDSYCAAATSITNKTQAQIVDYYHKVLFSPTASTMQYAVDMGYVTFPGLSSEMIRKYPPNTIATSFGHLNQSRQGVRSTKQSIEVSTNTDFTNADTIPKVNNLNNATHKIQTKIIITPHRQNYTDQTGKFPVTSSSGSNYMLIMFCEDINYIHGEALKSRMSTDIVEAYKRGIEFFEQRQVKPEFERLDNETSKLFEDFCFRHNIKIQYVPPGNHRANKSERAIQTWKNHFIAGLSSCDPDFPLSGWDELNEQAELTINIMRSSAITDRISAWEQLHGKFLFDQTPLAPPGMKVVVHEKPDKRSSWAPHGKIGFYVGPALKHYRCYRVYMKSTNTTRITDTLSWHPSNNLFLPGSSSYEDLFYLLNNLEQNLSNIAANPQSLNHHRQPIEAIIPNLSIVIQQLQTIFSTSPSSPSPSIKTSSITSGIPIVENTFPITTKFSVDATATAPSVTEQRVIEHEQPSVIEQRVVVLDDDDEFSTAHITRPKRIINRPKRFCGEVFTHSANEAADLSTVADPKSLKEAKLSTDSKLWETEETNELLRLIEKTKTMHFLSWKQKPRDRLVSYYNPQVKQKMKDGNIVRRVRGVYGGNRTDYNGEVSANTADITTIKLFLNAVVSENADLVTTDISDFYLHSKLPRPEYMRIHRKHVPLAIQSAYSIDWQNDFALLEITMGIYGLPQAGLLANMALVQHLKQHDYIQTPNTPCLFKHATRPVYFTLVVDDFLIKANGNEHIEHLLDVLKLKYKLTTDYNASRYVGMSIKYDRIAHTLETSVPNYVNKFLEALGVTRHNHSTDSASIYIPPTYGIQSQQIAIEDTTSLMSESDRKQLQSICGTFSWYARITDPTMLTAINKLSSAQARPTEAVAVARDRFLQYAASHPNAIIQYKASDMRYVIHSDGSHLSERNATSRAGGFGFLTNNGEENDMNINGAVECISKIIPSVTASVCETEYAAQFINGQSAEGIRNTLSDLGYPQQATTIVADNKCAVGLANNTMKQRRSKSIDMQYHWIRDRVAKNHFKITWKPGAVNFADYFTKSHPVHHCRKMRHFFVKTSELAQANSKLDYKH